MGEDSKITSFIFPRNSGGAHENIKGKAKVLERGETGLDSLGQGHEGRQELSRQLSRTSPTHAPQYSLCLDRLCCGSVLSWIPIKTGHHGGPLRCIPTWNEAQFRHKQTAIPKDSSLSQRAIIVLILLHGPGWGHHPFFLFCSGSEQCVIHTFADPQESSAASFAPFSCAFQIRDG